MNCPDCGAVLDLGRNQLTQDEFTSTMDCPDCDFGIETMSNIAHRHRMRGWDGYREDWP